MSALGFLSKASTKFFHEVAPVALASVIGTLLINHYTRHAALTPVVVQPSPPPPEMLQTLHDEQELIVGYLKRDAEAKRFTAAEPERAPASPAATRAVKDGPAKVRQALRPPSKMATAREIGAQDPMPLGPDLASLPAPEPPAHPQAIAANLVAEGTGVAGAARDWVVNVAQYPARALAPVSFAGLRVVPWPFQFTRHAPSPPD
jgi:hypothetical protein